MKLLATFLLLRTLTKELLASCFFFVVIIISLLFWCVSPPLGTVENGKPNGNTESGPLAESRSSDPPNSSPNSNLERRCSTTGRGVLWSRQLCSLAGESCTQKGPSELEASSQSKR